MKIQVFSDIHGDKRALERVLSIEADLYFAAGDLATWGRGLDDMGAVLHSRAPRVYVLPGNHESEQDVARMCLKFALHPFHGRTMMLNGWNVAGLGYSSPTPFHTPGEYSESEMGERLRAFDTLEKLVMICHCPPRDTDLDLMAGGGHGGSRAVKEFVERKQPAALLCGHIHESAGTIVRLGETLAVNVGKSGYLLDFDKMAV